MFINRHFQHDLLKKNVILFGTIFNNIYITRTENQAFKVPIEYGPREKWLGITQPKPGDKRQASISPRMSYEHTGMQYDSQRKVNRNNIILDANGKQVYRGIPWNYNFELNVMGTTNTDVMHIVEQALTYFNPDFTVDVKFLDGFEHLDRVTIVYNSISHEDRYEGSFTDRRYIIYTINFTVKSFLYGPMEEFDLIKYIDLRFHGDFNQDTYADRITIQPGLTANGEPTTDINETINYQLIDIDDDWGVIEQYEEGWKEDD